VTFWWLVLAMSLASNDELLTPRVGTLDRQLIRVERLLGEAERYQRALARAQSAFVLEGCARGGCPAVRAAGLIVTAQTNGHSGRDLLQSARAELDRARRTASSPLVKPLVGEARSRRLGDLAMDTEQATRAWLIRSSWYERVMRPWEWTLRKELANACAAPVDAVEVVP
jgi:hypothetical protein